MGFRSYIPLLTNTYCCLDVRFWEWGNVWSGANSSISTSPPSSGTRAAFQDGHTNLKRCDHRQIIHANCSTHQATPCLKRPPELLRVLVCMIAPSVWRSPSLEHIGWFQIPERSTTSFQAHYLQQISLQDWQKKHHLVPLCRGCSWVVVACPVWHFESLYGLRCLSFLGFLELLGELAVGTFPLATFQASIMPGSSSWNGSGLH